MQQMHNAQRMQMPNPQMMPHHLQIPQRPPMMAQPPASSTSESNATAADSAKPVVTTYLTASSVFTRVPTNAVLVYIGKIPPDLDERLLRSMLAECGDVIKWSRLLDPNTKQPKAFGFCEFDNATAALRCINCLNDYSICGGTIQAKAGTKETEMITAIRDKEFAEAPETSLALDAACLTRISLAVDIAMSNKEAANATSNQIAADNLCSISIPIQRTSGDSTQPAYDAVEYKEAVLQTEIEKFRIRQLARDKEIEVGRRGREGVLPSLLLLMLL
jgi:hypothetical protein